MSAHVHDFVAIGAGPFNLGLAALAEPVADLDGVVLEARDDVTWHAGMLLADSTLQVPFLGDLVTMADPTNRWSYLSWLKQTGMLYPFYVREDFHPLRREYSDYLRWAADGLASVHLGQEVVAVTHDGEAYVVTTAAGAVRRTRRVVLGVGTTPRLPECVRRAGGPAVHTAGYLAARDELLGLGSVAVVGSGQSAAEAYLDLLDASHDGSRGPELTWLTRSPRFFAMDDSRLTLEMTSPEYTAYFQGLDDATRARLLAEQPVLYKGISSHTIDAISALHYRLRATGEGPRATLVAATELIDATWDGQAYDLALRHTETGEAFGLRTEGLVIGTGYTAPDGLPAFLEPVRDRLRVGEDGRLVAGPTYAVDHAQREVFVQNAEEHTHGFVAPDLGMGAFRSSVLVNAMTGRELYAVEKRVAVQSFGVPDHLRSER